MDITEGRRRLEAERERLLSLREEDEEVSDLNEEQSESAGDLADYDQHPGDVGTETFERTKDIAVHDQIDEHLRDVEDALARVEDGTYGQCAVCGRQIDDERLAARPATRYCKEHQEQVDEDAGAMREEEGP